MSDTVREMKDFQRQADKLLRELGLELESALLGYKDPKSKAKPFEQRYAKLCKDLDAWVKGTPHAKDWAELLKQHVKKDMDQLIARAYAAHRRRGQVDGNLKKKYNEAVGGALAEAPKQVSGAAKQQLERGIRQLIDAQLPDEVPSDVKGQLARALGQWAGQQPLVEDALFVVQHVVSDVAVYLHERLTIKGQIETIRAEVARRSEITAEEASAADQQVGALAKRGAELDKTIERRVRESTRKVSHTLKLDPKVVLDPSVRFLKQVEAKAGIHIQSGNVKVDLGTRLRVTNPLLGSRKVDASANADFTVQGQGTLTRFGVGATATDLTGTTAVGTNAYVNMNVNKNLDLGASYSNTWKEGQGWQGHQVRATLTWRF